MLRRRRLSETLNLIFHYLFLVNLFIFCLYVSCSFFEVYEGFAFFLSNCLFVVSWIIIFGSILNIFFSLTSKIFDNSFPAKIFLDSILNLVFSFVIYFIVSFVEISITQGLSFSF